MAIQEAISVREFIREMLRQHQDNGSFGIPFACSFPSSAQDTVDVLEISPDIMDPGDESFYGVLIGTPEEVQEIRRLNVILVTPEEFYRALGSPETPGGAILSRLRQRQDYDVLIGRDSEYEMALRARPSR